MRKEMVIRVQTSSSDKGASCKAIKVAAGVKGVESVTLAGEDKNLLLVIGVGVDSNRITKKLRQKVGHAEVVELRTVDAADDQLGGAAYRYHPMSPSPYNYKRDNYYAGGGGSYPVARDQYTMAPSPYKHQYQQHAGGRDYYYGSGAGGYYPATQYNHHQQHMYQYQPPPGNVHTVVHHEYANNDPNNCSIM